VVLALLFDPPVDLDGAPIPAKSRVILQPTPVCVSSDNVAMTRVVGSPDGRIFMGGRDGQVYELEYGIESGWSGTARKSRKKTCKMAMSNLTFYVGRAGKFLGFGSLVNHYLPEDGAVKMMCVDSTRGHMNPHTGKRMGLLYVLTDPSFGPSTSREVVDSSCLECYAILANGLHRLDRYDGAKLKQEISRYIDSCMNSNEYSSVTEMPKGSQELPTSLVSISVVPRHGAEQRIEEQLYKRENGSIHLMGVTVTGARVYFSAEYSMEDGFTYGPNHQMDLPIRFSIWNGGHVQPLPQRGLLEKQLDRGESLTDPIRIDSTLPNRSFLTSNLTVLHTTEDAVLTEGAGDATSTMLAIGVDYAKRPPPSRDHHHGVGMHSQGSAFAGQQQVGFLETVQVIPVERDQGGIPVRVLAMAQSPYPFGSNIFQSIHSGLPDDELITQQDQWPRELLCLKEDGLQSYLKLRPLEWMAMYLQYPQQWGAFREEMFQEYGHDEGCAMCLTLACGDFSLLPRESVLQSINRDKIHQAAMDVLETDKIKLIGRPEAHQFAIHSEATQQFDQFGAAVPSFTKRYSHRFEGMVIYATRLLQPVWEYNITEVSKTRGMKPSMTENFPLGNNPDMNPDPNNLQDLRLRSRDQWNALVVSLDALIKVIERLYPASDLSPPLRQQFVQRDMEAISGFMREYNAGEGFQGVVDREREASRAESRLVFGLYQLLKLSREAAKLFRILCRTETKPDAFFSEMKPKGSLRFPMIVGKLYTFEQAQLATLTFKDLVTKREHRLAGKPLNKLLHMLVTLASDAGQANFSAPFIRDCPSFFGQPDQSRLTAKGILDQARVLKSRNPTGYDWKHKVEDAMEEYRKVMYHVAAGEVGKFLADLGRYGDAVEISLLKTARTLQQSEKDELIELSIKYVENIWQRKHMPERYISVDPEMGPEEVEEQWTQTLGNALYFGGVQHLKDGGTFFFRLFQAFCRLGEMGKGHMLALARSHAHLVDPYLYQFLETHHLEDLYRAYEQAGRFEEAAHELKKLAEETVESRRERYATYAGLGINEIENATPSDLLEQRVRWLSQAILCLQGTGMELNGGTSRSLSDLMQILHDSREVLEVQVHLKEALVHSLSIAVEMRERLETGVLTNTEMWWLLDSQGEGDGVPLWQREHLYGLCLRVLSLTDERMNERYVEKVGSLWHQIIEEAYCREGLSGGIEGIQTDVEKWGKAFCPLHSIREEEGSVFPLQRIIDFMEQRSHETAMLGRFDGSLDSVGWVVNTLHMRVKIPYMALFSRYKLLLSDPLWQPRQDQPQKQIHLLKSMAYLLKVWLSSRRDDDIRDLSIAQIDFEDFQIKLVANTPYYANQLESDNLQQAFQDAMERRRHLNW